MSLVLVSEPEKDLPREASELSHGTWFIDNYDQVYVVAHDDRSCEKRIVCTGDFCDPFIPNIAAKHIEVKQVLRPGSVLEITSAVPLLEGR